MTEECRYRRKRVTAAGKEVERQLEEELRRIVIPGIFGVDSWWVFPGPVAALQIPLENAGFDLSRRAIIRRAHQHEQAVHYWTIDDPEMMRTLTERGADGIITDRPDLAREVFTEMGFTLPSPVRIEP